MGKPLDKKFSRRVFLKSAVFAAGAAAVPSMMLSGRARAAGKLPKSAVQYQEHPKNGKQCSECIQFIPGSGGKGTCKVVQGSINPKGYCVAFVPKS